jgi:hypothetical protein
LLDLETRFFESWLKTVKLGLQIGIRNREFRTNFFRVNEDVANLSLGIGVFIFFLVTVEISA